MRSECPVCGKWSHTRKRAEDIARKYRRRRGERVMAYPCPHGRGFHVGHAQLSQGERKRRRR